MPANTTTPKKQNVPFFKSIRNGKFLNKRALIVPTTNIIETVENYLLSMAVPGFKREDLKIEIAHNIITISAAKEVTTLVSINNRCEYDYTNWTRSFTLPGNADVDLAEARYREGELIIRIPKGTIIQTKEPVIVYVY